MSQILTWFINANITTGVHRCVVEGQRDFGTLTALQSVTYHWTPHGFSLQVWAVIGWCRLEHFDSSTTSMWPLLLKIQATLRVCVPFPHSAEHLINPHTWGVASNECCFNSVYGCYMYVMCVCRLPDPKVLYTTLAGFGMGLSHKMSLPVGAPLRSCPVGDQSHDPSGILLSGFDCPDHTLQSTEDCHTRTR